MICPEIPQAVGTGGQVRSYHFLMALAQRYELTLIVLKELSDDQMRESLSGMCNEIIAPPTSPVERKPDRWPSILRTLQSILFPWKDHWIDFLDRYQYYYRMSLENDRQRYEHKFLLKLFQTELSAFVKANPPPLTTHYLHRTFGSIQKSIAARLASDKFDLIFTEHTFTFPVVQSRLTFPNKPVLVCNAHNIESIMFHRLAKNDPIARRHNQIQARILQRWEKRTLEYCDVTIVCSERDRHGAQDLHEAGTYQIVPNGVDIDYFAPRPMVPQPVPRVLFTGAMGYPPNKDAACFFINEIFPFIRKKIPNCEFIIAGRNADREFPSNIQSTNTTVISDPTDMRPIFDQAGVVIVPLRLGGGTRLKILEALSIGRAVVSTRIGAEGVPYQDGNHLILADEPKDFALAVVRLLLNPEQAKQLALSGQKWARKHYSWKTIRNEAIDKVANRLE